MQTPVYDMQLRRASNDGRRAIFGTTQAVIAFVCECASECCFETVRLTAREFDTRRPGAVVADGHPEGA